MKPKEIVNCWYWFPVCRPHPHQSLDHQQTPLQTPCLSRSSLPPWGHFQRWQKLSHCLQGRVCVSRRWARWNFDLPKILHEWTQAQEFHWFRTNNFRMLGLGGLLGRLAVGAKTLIKFGSIEPSVLMSSPKMGHGSCCNEFGWWRLKPDRLIISLDTHMPRDSWAMACHEVCGWKRIYPQHLPMRPSWIASLKCSTCFCELAC